MVTDSSNSAFLLVDGRSVNGVGTESKRAIEMAKGHYNDAWGDRRFRTPARESRLLVSASFEGQVRDLARTCETPGRIQAHLHGIVFDWSLGDEGLVVEREHDRRGLPPELGPQSGLKHWPRWTRVRDARTGARWELLVANWPCPDDRVPLLLRRCDGRPTNADLEPAREVLSWFAALERMNAEHGYHGVPMPQMWTEAAQRPEPPADREAPPGSYDQRLVDYARADAAQGSRRFFLDTASHEASINAARRPGFTLWAMRVIESNGALPDLERAMAAQTGRIRKYAAHRAGKSDDLALTVAWHLVGLTDIGLRQGVLDEVVSTRQPLPDPVRRCRRFTPERIWRTTEKDSRDAGTEIFQLAAHRLDGPDDLDGDRIWDIFAAAGACGSLAFVEFGDLTIVEVELCVTTARFIAVAVVPTNGYHSPTSADVIAYELSASTTGPVKTSAELAAHLVRSAPLNGD